MNHHPDQSEMQTRAVMSDRLRRSICRLAFLVFCLAPTVLVMVAILFPPSRRGWEQQLSQRIGLNVSIGKIRPQNPRTCELHDLRLWVSDRDFALQLNQVTVQRGQRSFDCLATDSKVELDVLAQILKRALERQTTDATPPKPFHLRMKTLVVETGSTAQSTPLSLHELDLKIHQTEHGWMARLEFRIGSPEAGPVFIQLEQTDSEREWTIETGDSKLPMLLAESFCSTLQRFGALASFQGKLTAHLSDQSSHWKIDGQLTDVDLSRVAASSSHMTISGHADIQDLKLEVSENRIVQMSGTLESPDGLIDGSWLTRMAEWPGLKALESGDGPQRFASLNVRFQLEEGRLFLSAAGQAHDPRNLAILPNENSPQRPLIQQSEEGRFCEISWDRFLTDLAAEKPAPE